MNGKGINTKILETQFTGEQEEPKESTAEDQSKSDSDKP